MKVSYSKQWDVEEPIHIGSWLREVIKNKGLTYTKVWERSGPLGDRIARSTLSKIISGGPRRQLETDTVAKLARGVGEPESVIWLVLRGELPVDQKSKEAVRERMIRLWSELPSVCQDDVVAVVETLWQRRHVEGHAERVAAVNTQDGGIRPATAKEQTKLEADRKNTAKSAAKGKQTPRHRQGKRRAS